MLPAESDDKYCWLAEQLQSPTKLMGEPLRASWGTGSEDDEHRSATATLTKGTLPELKTELSDFMDAQVAILKEVYALNVATMATIPDDEVFIFHI